MAERVSTGIPGLDQLIDGGLPEGSVSLLSGDAGTGKTVLCSQFLWNGLQQNQNGLFITMEEDPDDLRKDAKAFGWDFEEYENAGYLRLTYLNPFSEIGDIRRSIKTAIDEVDAERVVVDSTSILGMYSNNIAKIRERIYELASALHEANVTALMTAEIPEGEDGISRYSVEEFVADGVIVLKGPQLGDTSRQIMVKKMRRTPIDDGTYDLAFDENGLRVS